MNEFNVMGKHFYDAWCDKLTTPVSGNSLHAFSEKAGGRAAVSDQILATVRAHYEDPKRLAKRAKRLGFKKASKFLEEMLPKTKTARSGHLGEIFAAEAVPILCPTFKVPIKKLRWNDGRNTAMRGEDTIAISIEKGHVRFLKGESKSGASVTPTIVSKARKALKANRGRPSQHAMGFLSQRLSEIGEEALARLVEDYMVDKSIALEELVHMIFTFSGNDAVSSLTEDLKDYTGKIEQHSVNLKVDGHQKFVKTIYDEC